METNSIQSRSIVFEFIFKTFLRSALDYDEYTQGLTFGSHTEFDIDPGEYLNMLLLSAIDVTQGAEQRFCLNDFAE